MKKNEQSLVGRVDRTISNPDHVMERVQAWGEWNHGKMVFSVSELDAPTNNRTNRVVTHGFSPPWLKV